MKKILWSVGVLFVASVFGQEKEEQISEVGITGKFLNLPYKKVNENISILSKKDIENAAANSIDEILQQLPGIDIARRGPNGVQSDISFRGGTFDQTLILINGIRMNDSQTGHNSLNIPIDLSNVERIEIMKGPAARRFGQNAYSGVINIITKATGKKFVKIAAQGGDYSTYNLGASTRLGNEKFSNFIQVNSGSSEGYQYNTDYKINNIFYQNAYQIKDGAVQLQAGFSEKKFGANGFYASPAFKDQYEETQASLVSIAYKQKLGQLHLNSNIYWRRGQDMYLLDRIKPQRYRNMHIGNNIGGEFNSSYTSSIGTTGVGVELKKEYLISSNLGERNRFISQVFLEHHFSLLNNKFQISPGISWGNITNVGNFFYPGIDLGYDFDSHNKIFANLSKVHRIPTFTDLYYISGTERGNPNLMPENAVSYEFGYRYLKNKFMANVSIFGRESNNAIDWAKDTNLDKWQALNIGQISTKGFEASISQKLSGFFSAYSLGYNYLENKLELRMAFSKYATNQLKHQLVAKVETKFLKHFSNELVYRYNQRTNGYSYHLLDEKLNFSWNQIRVYILVNNITNTQYTEAFGVLMPARWFHLGFSYEFGIGKK